MNNKPVGVFDSGLGGLAVVKELFQVLADEAIVYFGDTARLPYGTRSGQVIKKYVDDDIRFLQRYDTKIIVAACGTASAVALPSLADSYDVPIVGIVEPSAKAAVNKSKNGRIGVLGTSGTIGSGLFERMIKAENADAAVFSVACPMFVPLVENGYLAHEVTYLIGQEYLAPLKKEKVDTIILGCTHFPLLKEVICDIMGSDVVLVDSGAETAKEVRRLLSAEGTLRKGCTPEHRFFVSDNVASFEKIGSMFLNSELPFAAELAQV